MAAYSLDPCVWGFGKNWSEAIANAAGTASRHPHEWPDNASARYADAAHYARKTATLIAALLQQKE
jgi:hypothetical protein